MQLHPVSVFTVIFIQCSLQQGNHVLLAGKVHHKFINLNHVRPVQGFLHTGLKNFRHFLRNFLRIIYFSPEDLASNHFQIAFHQRKLLIVKSNLPPCLAHKSFRLFRKGNHPHLLVIQNHCKYIITQFFKGYKRRQKKYTGKYCQQSDFQCPDL